MIRLSGNCFCCCIIYRCTTASAIPCDFSQCLEDAGIKLKRFAGSSIGSTIAGLLSVGYSSDELIALYIQDLSIFIRGKHVNHDGISCLWNMNM